MLDKPTPVAAARVICEMRSPSISWSSWVTQRSPDDASRYLRPLFFRPTGLREAAKARRAATRQRLPEGIVRVRRPKYLFSGLAACETCGGGFILSSHELLTCFNARSRGTCSNRRSIKRQDVEARVVRAMRERFFERGAFAEFCAGFTEDLNRLRREHRTQLASAPREIASLKRRSDEILNLLLEGFRNNDWKDELRRIDERRAELEAAMAAAAAKPPEPALHPMMAEVFQRKATQLAAALERDEERDQARQALRGFIEKIVIPPGDGLLQVVGNLGEMLTAASGRNASTLAAVGNVGCAGARPEAYRRSAALTTSASGLGVAVYRTTSRPSTICTVL